MNAVVQVEPPRLPSLQSGGAVRAIVPQDFDGAWRIATAVCKAGMAPKGLDTPEKAMVAIMHGMEVGLTPMAALQSIAVVNGRPTIWGDGAIGLVRASGLCEYIQESIQGEGENMVAVCEVKRKGEKQPIIGRFSVADAKKAGLWAKQGPWTQYPKRMLAMRARAFPLRDGFADVLRGLGIAEEVQDFQHVRDVTPPRAPRPPSPPSAQIAHHKSEPIDAAEIVTETGEATDAILGEGEPFDLDAFLSEIDAAMATGKDADQVIEIWDGFDVEATLTDDEAALQRAFDLRAARLVKFNPVNGG